MGAPHDRQASLEFWRAEVLRRAAQALQGRVVGLFEARGGTLIPIVIGLDRPLPPTAGAEVNEALRRWKVPIAEGSRWLAARLDMGRWVIAPVRSELPPAPKVSADRRRKERMALELAGLCLGLIEERVAREE